MTDIEKRLAEANGILDEKYGDRVNKLIREQYSQSRVEAIFRKVAMGEEGAQEELNEFNEFANACKEQAKKEIYGDEE